MKYAALKCVLDRSQLRAFIFGANPSSQPGNLDSWMLSDFKIKLPTVGEKNLVSENHLPFRASRIHCFHIQDLSYCSNAFGSAVKVQIEMLKLVTEKKKKTHVTSLKGITCEACECIRTPVSVYRLKFAKCPNTLFLTCMKKEHCQSDSLH